MHERSSIKDQVAIVTGATDGIGLATAIRFADEGAKVAILGRDPERGSRALATVGAHGDAIYVSGDAARKEDIDLLFARTLGTWGRLDILVNCAGGFVEVSNIEDLDEAEWAKIVDWNLTSCYLASRAAAVPMKERGYGRIVNISSISARDALPNISLVYSAAKSAMQGFTRRLAVELAPHGITVNAVAPGVTLTKRFPPGARRARAADSGEPARGLRRGSRGYRRRDMVFLHSGFRLRHGRHNRRERRPVRALADLENFGRRAPKKNRSP